MGDEVGKIGMKLQDYSIRMLIVTDQRGPKKNNNLAGSPNRVFWGGTCSGII